MAHCGGVLRRQLRADDVTLRFHADCAFHIGAQHLRTGLPCQDYAVANALGDRAYAVVSDGCSSGGRTDVGARLIALGAAKALREEYRIDPTHIALEAARTFDLVKNDMLATCLSLSVGPDGVKMLVQGDGVTASMDSDGRVLMRRMDWSLNMPCYPIYSDDQYAQFIAAQGGSEAEAFHVQLCLNDDKEGVTIHRRVDKSVGGYLYGFDVLPRTVAIFSDGVTQVDGMEWQDVVCELMSFKSVEGDFVKRRLNRFLRDAEKRGRGPIDDIAMAAIVVEEVP